MLKKPKGNSDIEESNCSLSELNQGKSEILDLLKKELFSMRSELLHPYVGLKLLAYFDTIKFIQQNMTNSIACLKQNELFNHALSKVEISGLNAEFGVKSGKSIKSLCQKPKLRKDTIYGFDSFCGLPDDWTGTRTRAGRLKVSSNIPKLPKNVEIVKGWFKETLPEFLNQHKENFAFIHIDCDLYKSTKDILDNIKDRIVKGTIIIFDEYFNYPNWQQHEYKAFMEFVQANNVKFQYIGYAHTQVAIKII